MHIEAADSYERICLVFELLDITLYEYIHEKKAKLSGELSEVNVV